MRCRDGHESDEPDYCSVCGVAMSAPAAPMPSRGAPASPLSRNTPLPSSLKRALPNACPECGEPRTEADARFCEVCRYDFVSKKAGPPPVGASPSAKAPNEAPNLTPKPKADPNPKWELVVMVDPSLDTEPDPESPCPSNVPAATIAVDKSEMLVGRHDDRRDIHPELPVHDPGASRRHAKLTVDPDGSIFLVDLAPTNGTKLNGVEVAAGSRTPLKAGDEVTLGRWTRIKLRGRA